MTGAEICSIIEQCAKSKVQVIILPGLRLKFGEGKPASRPATSSKPTETTGPTVPALTEEQHNYQAKESLLDDEARTKEERLALMAIEDPSEYERLVLAGELEDLGADDGDEEALD